MMKRAALLAVLLSALACTDGREHAQAVCVLVDVSGTYADQVDDVTRIVRAGILPSLLPGDSLMLVAIDSESYEKDNVLATVHLDARPSAANAQKLEFARRLDALSSNLKSARHTDVSGAVMLGAELLHETGAGGQVLVVFSDMQEELPAGVTREMAADELSGISVVAMNVKKLDADNANPAVYRQRLADWQTRLIDRGATGWQIVVDSSRLVGVLSGLRER